MFTLRIEAPVALFCLNTGQNWLTMKINSKSRSQNRNCLKREICVYWIDLEDHHSSKSNFFITRKLLRRINAMPYSNHSHWQRTPQQIFIDQIQTCSYSDYRHCHFLIMVKFIIAAHTSNVLLQCSFCVQFVFKKKKRLTTPIRRVYRDNFIQLIFLCLLDVHWKDNVCSRVFTGRGMTDGVRGLIFDSSRTLQHEWIRKNTPGRQPRERKTRRKGRHE
jgi:hypothetical protein